MVNLIISNIAKEQFVLAGNMNTDNRLKIEPDRYNPPFTISASERHLLNICLDRFGRLN
jgi:hypothetical protein